MTKWRCLLCDYVFESDWPPTRCPRCGAPREKFEKVKEEVKE